MFPRDMLTTPKSGSSDVRCQGAPLPTDIHGSLSPSPAIRCVPAHAVLDHTADDKDITDNLAILSPNLLPILYKLLFYFINKICDTFCGDWIGGSELLGEQRHPQLLQHPAQLL